MKPFVGSLLLVAYNWAPLGWAVCNGQKLLINQYQAVFALLGATYGGDGTTNFALPNLPGPTDANSKQLTWIICLQGDFPSRS
jgi:microcystin-dependent protein